LLLVGDSLVQGWKDAYWGTVKTFNFGVAADKTQHALWRLHQLYPGQLDVERALILLGTNNLGADDGPAAIRAGVSAVVRRLQLVAPGVQCWVIEIPPCGPGFSFRNDDRRHANALLRSDTAFRSINVDEVLTTGFAADCRNYAPDHIHFSDEGYRVLTRYVLSRIR
jgi:lysophospholipase L1-like esterase